MLRVAAPTMSKVGIVTGGGTGHLPTFLGFVGSGLVDGVALGNVFASPGTDQIVALAKEVSAGRGVLLIYSNHAGDRLNFEAAADLAREEGLEIALVRVADDVASAPKDEADRRRGVAGIFFLFKVAGACAAAGGGLNDVRVVTERAAANVRSMGVAISGCTVPGAGRPTFELPFGEMEIGTGVHGEAGIRRGPLERADRVADRLLDELLADFPGQPPERVDVLVNGFGASPLEELYIVYRRVAARLDAERVQVRRVWVGEYFTSLEMAGVSISLLAIDDELAALLDAPAHSPLLARV